VDDNRVLPCPDCLTLSPEEETMATGGPLSDIDWHMGSEDDRLTARLERATGQQTEEEWADTVAAYRAHLRRTGRS
jgi:hypothetical protein